MKKFSLISILAASVLLSGCLMTAPVKEENRIDEVAMYGGIDRSKYPVLKAADEKFIADVTAQFGSRERASILWVNQGYKFYRQDHLGMAMRRFNQAWLLNPDNSEVYTGFAAVLSEQDKECEAMQMMEKALAMPHYEFQGVYPDAGRIVTLCSVSDKTLSAEGKAKLWARSEELYKKGEQVEPNKQYLYDSWATAYYWQGKYADAWAMVAKARKLGGQTSKRFLGMLQAKMPQPRT